MTTYIRFAGMFCLLMAGACGSEDGRAAPFGEPDASTGLNTGGSGGGGGESGSDAAGTGGDVIIELGPIDPSLGTIYPRKYCAVVAMPDEGMQVGQIRMVRSEPYGALAIARTNETAPRTASEQCGAELRTRTVAIAKAQTDLLDFPDGVGVTFAPGELVEVELEVPLGSSSNTQSVTATITLEPMEPGTLEHELGMTLFILDPAYPGSAAPLPLAIPLSLRQGDLVGIGAGYFEGGFVDLDVKVSLVRPEGARELFSAAPIAPAPRSAWLAAPEGLADVSHGSGRTALL
jgi:hypothetical protein